MISSTEASGFVLRICWSAFCTLALSEMYPKTSSPKLTSYVGVYNINSIENIITHEITTANINLITVLKTNLVFPDILSKISTPFSTISNNHILL